MTSVNHSKGFVFIHVPKNAGSYIQHLLHHSYGCTNYNYLARYDLGEVKFTLNLTGEHKNNESVTATNPYSSRLLGIHQYFSTSSNLLRNMCLSKEKWDDLYKFVFVRDPYARFISSWNFVIYGFKNRNNILKKSYNPEEIKKYDDIEFMIRNMDELTDIAYNHIFITQYFHILGPEGKIDMNYIGRVENIEADLEVVLKQVGFSQITHKQSTDVNKKEHNDYKTYYNQYILDFVNKWFADDFAHFHYTKYETLEEFLKGNEETVLEMETALEE